SSDPRPTPDGMIETAVHSRPASATARFSNAAGKSAGSKIGTSMPSNPASRIAGNRSKSAWPIRAPHSSVLIPNFMRHVTATIFRYTLPRMFDKPFVRTLIAGAAGFAIAVALQYGTAARSDPQQAQAGSGTRLQFTEPSPLDFNDHEGYTSIFDGRSLDGWDGNPKFWRGADRASVG